MSNRGTLPDGVDAMTILKAFHGHLGPYVVAGLRLGQYAVRRLQANPHFGIEVDVFCPDQPPPSCAMDGIQFASGCTLGKRNIRHHVAEGVTARFRNRKTGQEITVQLRPAAMEAAVQEMHHHDDEAGAAVIEAMSDEELIEELPQS
jgi:formylmethanofuran dehydrogenase subunit E